MGYCSTEAMNFSSKPFVHYRKQNSVKTNLKSLSYHYTHCLILAYSLLTFSSYQLSLSKNSDTNSQLIKKKKIDDLRVKEFSSVYVGFAM